MTGSYRTYYVNQKTGRDSNDGLTMDSPFASLFQVNRLKLYPGDKVLLARDSIFTVSADERQWNQGASH